MSTENELQPPPPEQQTSLPLKGVQFHRVETDRLTYRFLLAHAQIGHPPTSIEGAVSQDLEHSEQAWVRHFKLDVKKGWIDVDLGWVENPGIIFIQNRVGMSLVTKPNEEESAELRSRVLLLKTEDNKEAAPFKLRSFGGFFIAEANEIPKLQMMCLAGIAEVTIAVFPH